MFTSSHLSHTHTHTHTHPKPTHMHTPQPTGQPGLQADDVFDTSVLPVRRWRALKEPLTKVNLLVAAGTQVGLAREGGDAGGCGHTATFYCLTGTVRTTLTKAICFHQSHSFIAIIIVLGRRAPPPGPPLSRVSTGCVWGCVF